MTPVIPVRVERRDLCSNFVLRIGWRSGCILWLVLMSLPLVTNADSGDDLFRDHVVPIFQNHCVSCHNHRDPRGDFSLEDGNSLLESGFVEPGDAAASPLIDLIASVDQVRPEMPKSGPSLDDQQVAVIREWINAGAHWPDGMTIKPDPNTEPDLDWWSLQPISSPQVPEITDPRGREWARTPIDRFIWRKLNENGLSPAAAADRRTLIRRVTYDLTGLPPTAVEIEAFQTDTAPDAYEKIVDRLLDSPRYGERWARHWLDVVKYADSCGYDKDKLRPNAWPYRDYVIRSLNQDKRYSRFVQEQVAGDVLFPGEPDGILGLGFIAAGPWDFIGHVEVAESKIDGQVARNLDRDGMVSNTLNTFCSVTIQCARCHDHKFDPFCQQDYYALQAIFSAVDRADRVYAKDPVIESKRDGIRNEMRQRQHQLEQIDAQVRSAGGEQWERLERQISEIEPKVKPPEFGYHSQITDRADDEKWVALSLDEPRSIDRLVLRPCHDEFNQIGAGFGFPVRFRVEVDGTPVHEQTTEDFPNPKLTPVVIQVGKTASTIRIVATKLAKRKNDFHFALAEIELLDANGVRIAGDATITALDSIESPVRWRKSNLIDGIWFESSEDRQAQLKIQRAELLERLVGLPTAQRRSELQQQLSDAQRRLDELPEGKRVYAAATSFPVQGSFKPTQGRPREVRLLKRGEVASPGRVVEPGVLSLFDDPAESFELGLDDQESTRRAALARWLTSKKNPLTWRSIVNRVWHYHFGRGIVDTPNDFGRMGGGRSHPELLEWLSQEFRDGGEHLHAGSFKSLHRLIVTSSVYRQSSDHTQSGFDKDAGNRFLWRMNRRRLSAEEIRDSILFASGVLEFEMGGPGYYLFALEKTEHSPHFEYHKFDHTDPRSYRRSIYRFIARSQPDPFMTTLDCADSSQSTPKRVETQTPLQSLTMLNSEFNLEMAKRFAQRMHAESDMPLEQIELAMRILVGRSPSPTEQSKMLAYLESHGWENLSRIMFNLSEFVFID